MAGTQSSSGGGIAPWTPPNPEWFKKSVSAFLDAYSWDSPPIKLNGRTSITKIGLSTGDAAKVGVLLGGGRFLWQFSSNYGAALATQFRWGAAWNATSHGGRHMQVFDLDPAIVQNEIMTDMRFLRLLGTIKDGLTIRTIQVGGVDITYHAWKLPNDWINVGTYFGPK